MKTDRLDNGEFFRHGRVRALTGLLATVLLLAGYLPPSALMAAVSSGYVQEEQTPPAEENAGESQQEEGAQETAPQEEPPAEQAVVDEEEKKAFTTEEKAAKVARESLVERDPFDRLHFDDPDFPVIEINPLELEGYSVNQPIDPKQFKEGRAVFTLPEYPDRIFAAQWSAILKVERYSELVLEEARKAMDAGDFNVAFRALLFLSKQPDMRAKAELNQMMDRCLYLDGTAQLKNQAWPEALAAFEELYKRNPRFTGADKPVFAYILDAYQSFLQKEFDKNNFSAVRNILKGLAIAYGNQAGEEMQRWESRIRQQAESGLREVRAALDANDGFTAQQKARTLVNTVPELPESVAAYNTVIQQYPYVLVGASSSSPNIDPFSLENWAARRQGRLLVRTLMEFMGPSDEGGKYLFPNGRFQQIDELGLRYRFSLNPNPPPGVPPMTAYELSNRLFDLADPSSPEYYVPWARMVVGIEIENERSVTIRLRYPHVRPESIMPVRYFADKDSRSREDWGLYRISGTDGDFTFFDYNDRYPRTRERHPVIVERLFTSESDAADALVRGEIDVIDRVHPFDIARLSRNPDIVVKPYLIPLVHFIVPNPRNDFMRNDSFRRALVAGIDRDRLLADALTAGREIDGFTVISGPFPPGTSTADQLAYANNPMIKPRQYDWRLALVLAEGVKVQIRQILMRTETRPDVKIPELILAHPDTTVIRAACESIRQQLKAAGIPIVLRPLPPGATRPEDDNYDLLYCEIQIQEPLADSWRLFGPNGLVVMSDPTIEAALRRVDSSYSWAQVSRALRRVHQQTSSNVTILPLWQVVEHYAFRKNISGIGEKLVYLYQNVEKWDAQPVPIPESVTNTSAPSR